MSVYCRCLKVTFRTGNIPFDTVRFGFLLFNVHVFCVNGCRYFRNSEFVFKYAAIECVRFQLWGRRPWRQHVTRLWRKQEWRRAGFRVLQLTTTVWKSVWNDTHPLHSATDSTFDCFHPHWGNLEMAITCQWQTGKEQRSSHDVSQVGLRKCSSF